MDRTLRDLEVRPPKQQRSREAWNRVLDAGVAILEDGGYDAFTIAAVCERAAGGADGDLRPHDEQGRALPRRLRARHRGMRAEQEVFADAGRWAGLGAGRAGPRGGGGDGAASRSATSGSCGPSSWSPAAHAEVAAARGSRTSRSSASGFAARGASGPGRRSATPIRRPPSAACFGTVFAADDHPAGLRRRHSPHPAGRRARSSSPTWRTCARHLLPSAAGRRIHPGGAAFSTDPFLSAASTAHCSQVTST